jgi:hypothetical protein
MSNIGQPERETQNRVIALFRDELGYRYLDDWTARPDNSNIEDTLLTASLTKSGCNPAQIAKALYELRTEAVNPNRSLYGAGEALARARQRRRISARSLFSFWAVREMGNSLASLAIRLGGGWANYQIMR